MATTIVRERRAVFGNKRVVLATVTTSTASDTYNTKLKVIDAASIDPGTNASPTTVSVSGGTITIGSAGGVTSAQIVAIGT